VKNLNSNKKSQVYDSISNGDRTYRNTTQTLNPGLSQSVKDLNLTSECETFCCSYKRNNTALATLSMVRYWYTYSVMFWNRRNDNNMITMKLVPRILQP